MKNTAQKVNYLVIIVIIVFLAIFGVTAINNFNSGITNKPEANSRTSGIHNLNKLKISLLIPDGYQVDEKDTSAYLNDKLGIISIGRSGTNFNSIDNYVDDISKKNNLTLRNKVRLDIGPYATIKAETEDKRLYYIYVDGWVYVLSTTSPELYDDLDMIAKSFKYIPSAN